MTSCDYYTSVLFTFCTSAQMILNCSKCNRLSNRKLVVIGHNRSGQLIAK